MTTNQKRFTTYKSLSPVLTTQTTADFNPQCSDKRVSLVISANHHYMKFWTVIRSTLTLETCEESFSEPELFLDLG